MTMNDHTIPTAPGATRRAIRSLTLATVAAFALPAAAALAAPNLVPNPQFSIAAPCPTMIDAVTGQIHFAPPWQRAGQSPDFFHGCSVPFATDVPGNSFGWQGSAVAASTTTGGYAGVSVWFDGCEDCREYIQVPLDQALVAGTSYRVSFHVSLAENTAYAIDRLGAHLSNGALPALAGGVQPVVPQVENQGPPIVDMDDWVLVTGTFAAAGGEDHLTIGNFREDFEVDAVPISGMSGAAYYYIDAVSVQEADIDDLKNPTTVPDDDGMMSVVLTGAVPGSRTVLYGASSLATTVIDGHRFDVGPSAVALARATVDATGEARFEWPWQASLALADPDSGFLYLEAATEGCGGLVDSDEVRITLRR